MKILTIIGARPQFIKAAMVSHAIAIYNNQEKMPLIVEEIIHTGQHYDANMSDIFFRQMQIPAPVVNLSMGNGRHGKMTGRMLEQIEKEIIERNPDWVLVYGDTNSTLAGALSAAKLHIPIAHVEAGLRSFNKRMPEEINRILTDHVSTLLFCPTKAAIANLAGEGIISGVHLVGDVMYDAAVSFGKIAKQVSTILSDLGLLKKQYLLATVHRAENTDNPHRLDNILQAFKELSADQTLVFPIHPRTRKKIPASTVLPSTLRLIEPVSYIDMVQLEKNARIILTDSGGIQKEAYFHGVPCITFRDETEWVETVIADWNQVVGANSNRIVSAVNKSGFGQPIMEYGDGNSSEIIVKILSSS